MPEFDFEAAWQGIAKPYYDKLRPEFKAFHQRVATEGRDWRQDQHDLGLIVGCPPDLLDWIAGIPAREIAIAACTLYYWGHWGHTGDATLHYPGMAPLVFQDTKEDKYGLGSAKFKAKEYAKLLDQYPPGPCGEWKISMVRYGPTDGTGANWKCAHILDRYLQKAIDDCNHRKLGLHADSGKLRLHISRRDGWENHDVGWALPETVERLFELGHELARQHTLEHDPDRAWFTVVEDYQMCKKPYSSSDLKVLAKSLVTGVFEILDVRGANYKVQGLPDHRAHPFCIGPAHMEAAQKYGGHLGEAAMRAAPCAFQEKQYGERCGRPYDAHTHDTVMFLKCLKMVPNQEAAQVLSAIKDKNEQEWKVPLDGFAFVENQGFVILPPEDQEDGKAPPG